MRGGREVGREGGRGERGRGREEEGEEGEKGEVRRERVGGWRGGGDGEEKREEGREGGEVGGISNSGRGFDLVVVFAPHRVTLCDDWLIWSMQEPHKGPLQQIIHKMLRNMFESHCFDAATRAFSVAVIPVRCCFRQNRTGANTKEHRLPPEGQNQSSRSLEIHTVGGRLQQKKLQGCSAHPG